MFDYKDFPKKLITAGYNLKDFGLNEIAWRANDALKVIDFLIKNKYIILGGDVYHIQDHTIVPTCDSWYINKSSEQGFIEKSKLKALKYILDYKKRNGDSYIYTIVFETSNNNMARK